MKTYDRIQGEAEGPEASRRRGIREHKEQIERVSSNQGGRNWHRADVRAPPPLLEASVPSCKRRSWMPTRAGTLPWLGRLQSSLLPAGARGKAATDRMAEAQHSLPRKRGRVATGAHTHPPLGASPTPAWGTRR